MMPSEYNRTYGDRTPTVNDGILSEYRYRYTVAISHCHLCH